MVWAVMEKAPVLEQNAMAAKTAAIGLSAGLALFASRRRPASPLLAQTPAADAAATVLAATRQALGGEQKLAGVKSWSRLAGRDRCAARTWSRSNSRSLSSCPIATCARTRFRRRKAARRRAVSTATELIQFPLVAPRAAAGPAREGASTPSRSAGHGTNHAARRRQTGFRPSRARHVRRLVRRLPADLQLCRQSGGAGGEGRRARGQGTRQLLRAAVRQ